MLEAWRADVAELVDASDLKSVGAKAPSRFESGRRHQNQRFNSYCGEAIFPSFIPVPPLVRIAPGFAHVGGIRIEFPHLQALRCTSRHYFLNRFVTVIMIE